MTVELLVVFNANKTHPECSFRFLLPINAGIRVENNQNTEWFRKNFAEVRLTPDYVGLRLNLA